MPLDLREILLRDRFRAYKALFYGENGQLNASGERVIADLKKFCRGDRSTHMPGDPYSSANLEGRREVFLRICSFLHLDENDFFNLKEELPHDGAGSTVIRTASGAADIGEFD